MGRQKYYADFDDHIEDVASEIMCLFFATSDFDRPQSEHSFEIWAYKIAKHRKNLHWRQVRSGIEFDGELSEHERGDNRGALLRSNSVWHLVWPEQEFIVNWKDVVAIIEKMPEPKRTFMLDFLKGGDGDICNYAEEKGISLFDAMEEIKANREILRRIADDMSEERKETTIGHS